MAETIGLDYLQSAEKALFEANARRVLEVPARTIMLGVAAAICISDGTFDWRYYDQREVRGRQIVEWSKPRTIAKPNDEFETLVSLMTCGKAHPRATRVGDVLRSSGLDELDGYVNSPLDRANPAHMDLIGGYRPERPDDVEHTLAVLSSKDGRRLMESRAIGNISLAGPPQLYSYTAENARSDEEIEIRSAIELAYFWNTPGKGGASRRLDRKMAAITVPKILMAKRNHGRAKAHNALIAAGLVAAAEAAAVTMDKAV